ncbi:MAG TPA: nucleoside-diphosphate sugar epimerase/dehydratase [Gammaproteobacteria bacterium]|nr:nucleoside-diphosphate sugar epimerase/dehydratase [Gammaproteobacteria bacterium]
MSRDGNGWQLLRNRWTVFAHDLLWVAAAILFAYWIRFNLGSVPSTYLRGAFELVAVALPVHALVFWFFGCYRGIWRYASIPDLVRIIKAVLVGALATVLTAFLIGRLDGVPRSVLVLYPLLLCFGLGGGRMVYRILKDSWDDLEDAGTHGGRALIVGAGRAGELLIRDLKRNSGPFLPVALVDDDPSKHGHEVHGVRVRGYLSEIRRLVSAYEINIVLIAIPSASREVMDLILQQCNEAKVVCRTLPSLGELADGRVEISRLRPVTVEDLLGREPVMLDSKAISDFFRDKCILVTGGGGSIGSELCRQLLCWHPRKLIVLDNSEYNIYKLGQELNSSGLESRLQLILGDVQDAGAVEELFARHKPQIVFHAAAYKHVPIVEENALEGVRNNVVGTKVLADAAVRNGNECFVLISTDKTVNPVSVMGASKRVAELYCQGLSYHAGAHFITTRFGNVLGSTGSVVPLFEQQIACGGPVTVTHPEVTRYFMTISEAASLILQAAAMGRGGEIFVLDMGQPVRIRDLAEQMIRLSGLKLDRDIKVAYTGLRPGEKLHEELFYAREALKPTTHPKLLLAECCTIDWERLNGQLHRLETSLGGRDLEEIFRALKATVPEFEPGKDAEIAQSVADANGAANKVVRLVKN